jgi:hypothetical protein
MTTNIIYNFYLILFNILHGESLLPTLCLYLILLKSISIQVYFGGIEYTYPYFNQ